MKKSPCRWVPGWGYYLPSHEITCRDHDCVGCQPCTHEQDGPRKGRPARHCTGRGTGTDTRNACTNHLDDNYPRTCIRCIARTRKHLAELEVWHYRDLYQEALQVGVNSEALLLAAPALGTAQIIDYDVQHPLSVLSRWAFLITEAYKLAPPEPGAGRTLLAPEFTVGSAAARLTRHLDLLAQDADQDWQLFATEVNACHSHLAAVLHILDRGERGAPCPVCPDPPRLEKFYRNQDDQGNVDLEGAFDLWWCSSCNARWSEDDYRQWVDVVYLEHAERLTVSQLTEIYGVPAGTIWRWANEEPPRVKKRGYDGQRRQLYDVADVKAALDARTKETA